MNIRKSSGTRSEMSSSSQLTENVIKEYKKKIGKVVYIAISARTTIELPASLTQAERDDRVELYKRLHPSRI